MTLLLGPVPCAGCGSPVWWTGNAWQDDDDQPHQCQGRQKPGDLPLHVMVERWKEAMDSTKALTTEQVAFLLSLDAKTLRRWPADRLPYFLTSPGGDRRYLLRDVEDYIRRHRVEVPG